MGQGGAAGRGSGTVRPQELGWSAGVRVSCSADWAAAEHSGAAPLLRQLLHLLSDSPLRPPPRAHSRILQLAKPLLRTAHALAHLPLRHRESPGGLRGWPAPALSGLLAWLPERVSTCCLAAKRSSALNPGCTLGSLRWLPDCAQSREPASPAQAWAEMLARHLFKQSPPLQAGSAIA